jgi:hypothetical protein
MFSIIILACLGLILIGPNRSPSLVLFSPELLGSLYYCYLWFWVLKIIITHGHALLLLFYSVHDKTILLIGTWSLT